MRQKQVIKTQHLDRFEAHPISGNAFADLGLSDAEITPSPP